MKAVHTMTPEEERDWNPVMKVRPQDPCECGDGVLAHSSYDYEPHKTTVCRACPCRRYKKAE